MGECALCFLKWLLLVLTLCHGVIQQDTTQIAVNQITTSGFQALLTTDAIIFDVHLINDTHITFLANCSPGYRRSGIPPLETNIDS
jgi:hypothetical protein